MGLSQPGLFWTKVIFMIVCWAEAYFSGCFPTWSAGCRENPKILGIANAFASGVFLAIALIHILPEEVEAWDSMNEGVEMLFPLPNFLMFCGYSIILVLDKVAFDTSQLFENGGVDPARSQMEDSIKRSLVMQELTGQNAQPEIQKAMDDYNNPYDKFGTRMRASLKGDRPDDSQVKTAEDEAMIEQRLDPERINLSECITENKSQNLDDAEQMHKDQVNEMSLSQRDEKIKKKQPMNCKPYMLMIALCVHATFEGIATGITKDYSMCVSMVIAIVVHKGAAASALGISLVKNFPNDFPMCRRLMMIFALATPMGVTIGMIFANFAGETLDVVMSSLAGGTFIYIGCTEIIVMEFSKPDYKIQKFIAYLCGAALITSLCFMKGA